MTSLYYLRGYLRHHLGALGLGFLLVVCSSLAALVGPYVLREAIDSLGRAHRPYPLWAYALVIVVVAFIAAAFNFGTRWVVNGAARRIEYAMRNDLFRHFQRMELAFFHEHKVGDLVGGATNDLSAIRMMLGPGISNLLNTVVVFTITLIAMLTINWRLALLSGVFLPIMSLVFFLLGRRIERSYRRVQDQFGDLSATAQENFSGIRVVKAYVQEQHEIANFSRANRQYLDRSMHYARLTAGLWPSMTLVAGLSAVVILWFGGDEVISGALTVGQFVQFNAYLAQLAWPMIALGWSFKLFQSGGASLQRIREIVEREPAIASPPIATSLRTMGGAIEFRHVSLAYGDGPQVLHDVNLRIPAGATVAIVGPTGAGKSSLLNLIPRVYDPTYGHVLVDGVDVREWDLAALRRQVGYVTQETFLFSVPLRENIGYGVEEIAQQRVEEAATTSQLSRDVADFPQGYATPIGERGVTLSGGQKQRTSIARAVMKDPRILLLDDALSAVDTNTEEEILRRLRGVMEQRTSLIVSHRLSTVRDADVIVVLDEGRITEQGTHEELIRKHGLYAAMYRRQLLSEELNVDTVDT